mgnify:CR=1 FL=1
MNILYSRLVPLVGRRTFRFPDAAWRYVSPRFSQFGEDAALLWLMSGKPSGFYVDVGAYHPVKFSNTYLFYLTEGWRGINIDANPQSIRLFDEERPRDINVCAGISDKEEVLKYYQFEEGAINSLSEEKAQELIANGMQPISMEEVHTKTLKQLFEEHLPQGQGIDFMSVDCEGLDLQVLQSNDWDLFRPGILLAEEHTDKTKTAIEAYCHEIGYRMINWVGPTKFFKDVR